MDVTRIAHDRDFILAEARGEYSIVRGHKEQVVGPLTAEEFREQRARLGVSPELRLEALPPHD